LYYYFLYQSCIFYSFALGTLLHLYTTLAHNTTKQEGFFYGFLINVWHPKIKMKYIYSINKNKNIPQNPAVDINSKGKKFSAYSIFSPEYLINSSNHTRLVIISLVNFPVVFPSLDC